MTRSRGDQRMSFALPLPALGALIAVGLALVPALAPAQSGGAVESVRGPACITDAGHIFVNGKRSYGACAGGTAVTLAMIEAPPATQMCTTPADKPWDCGRWAAYVMLELTKKREVICVPDAGAKAQDGSILAVCTVGGRELNRTLVYLGWALPQPGKGAALYADALEHAKRERMGLWQGTFPPPAEWDKTPVKAGR